MQQAKPSPNLAPTKTYEDRPLAEKVIVFFQSWGKTIILLCQLVVLLSFLGRFILDEQLNNLNQKLKTQMATVKSLSAVETELRSVQTGLALVKAAKQDTFSAPIILETFSKLVPDTVYLTQISIDRGKLDFSARTGQPTDFANLVSNLKSVPTFKTITLNSAVYGATKQEFELSLTVTL